MKTVLKTSKKQKIYKPEDPCVDKINKLIILNEIHLFPDVIVKLKYDEINPYDVKYKDILSAVRIKYKSYYKIFGYSLIIRINEKDRLLILNERQWIIQK